MSSPNTTNQNNPIPTLTIQEIIDALSELHTYLSAAKSKISDQSVERDGNTNNNRNDDEGKDSKEDSKRRLIMSFLASLFSVPIVGVLRNNKNTTSKNNVEDRSSNKNTTNKNGVQDRSSNKNTTSKNNVEDRSSNKNTTSKNKVEDRSSNKNTTNKNGDEDRSNSSKNNVEDRSSNKNTTSKKNNEGRSSNSKNNVQDRSSNKNTTNKNSDEDRSSSSSSSSSKSNVDDRSSNKNTTNKNGVEDRSSNKNTYKNGVEDRSSNKNTTNKNGVKDRSSNKNTTRKNDNEGRTSNGKNNVEDRSSNNSNINNEGSNSININSSNTDDMNEQSAHNGYHDHIDIPFEFDKLCNDLNYMKTAFTKFKTYESDLGNSVVTLKSSLIDMVKTVEQSVTSKQIQPKLRKISKDVLNLKYKISVHHKVSSAISDAFRHPHSSKVIDDGGNYEFPSLDLSEEFTNSPVFKEIQEIFKHLELNKKLCLLCFSVFPEGAVVKKRLLRHWWIAERFVGHAGTGEILEETVDQILEQFRAMGFIEPDNKKRTPKANSFKMPPLVRYAVIKLAKDNGFFDSNEKGNLTMETWCQEVKKVPAGNGSNMNLEKLKTLFNVSERFPDFTFKWLSKMKDLRVLYLGRWESTAERHIEVENTQPLNDLKQVKQLTLLSFQGISRIEELPNSICKLPNLMILDLRACYNLEKLPDKIDSLKNLTQLDISECYLLDSMPKKLSSLSKLQVLKGFVISDAEKEKTCTLEDLSKLKDLRKLSINVNREAYKLEELIIALQSFKELQILKVAWGGGFLPAKADNNIEQKTTKPDKKGENKEEMVADKQKEEPSAAESGARNQDKSTAENQESSAVKSIVKQEKRRDNKTEKGNTTDSTETSTGEEITKSREVVQKKLDKRVDNEIEEISEAKPMEEITAAKSVATSQDNGDIGVAKSVSTKQNKKKEKKRVSFPTEEQKSTNLEKGGDNKNQESNAENSLSPNQDNREDTKKLEHGSPALARAISKKKSFAKSFSFKLAKEEAPKSLTLPSNLKKLELQCFPETKAPSWLMPENLSELQKLYISGGRLSRLGETPMGENKCKVEILRLKYLNELRMNWRELHILFPKVKYLEKKRCPKITFCPCDETGVWIKNPTKESKQSQEQKV